MTPRPLTIRAHEAQAIQSGRLSLIVRPMKPQPDEDGLNANGWPITLEQCPLGKPGDDLWCRETWGHDAPDLDACRRGVESDGPPYGPYYAADADWFDNNTVKMLSPVTMPRWASRFTLRVIEIDCKRVQEISEAEIIAMWCPPEYLLGQNWLRLMWDEWNGHGAWDRNEWVWLARVERMAG